MMFLQTKLRCIRGLASLQTQALPKAILCGVVLSVYVASQVTLLSSWAVLASQVILSADKQTIQQSKHQGVLEGHVKVKYQGSLLEAQKAFIKLSTQTDAPESMLFVGNPVLTKPSGNKGTQGQRVTGERMTVFFTEERFLVEGNTLSVLTPETDDKNTTTPTEIAEARLTVRANQQQYFSKQHIVTATGQVHVHYKDLQVQSGQAAVYLTPNQKPQRVVFTQSVTMQEKDKTLHAQKVTLLPDNKTLSAEGGVVSKMTGSQGSSGGQAIEVRSDTQHFDDGQKMMSASGHVQLKMSGYEARGSKAVYHMNQSKLVLTGRPTIKEASKQVTADRITIQTKPYQTFEAQGNVETRLLQAPKNTAPKAVATTTPSKKATSKKAKGDPQAKGSAKVTPSEVLSEEEAFQIPE